MARLIIALIFCVLGTIKGEDVENQESSEQHEPPGTDLQSIDSLAEITSAEVMPLMIFINPTEDGYQMPEKLVKFELNEGKIANGTKFVPRNPGNEAFLCPAETPGEKCLIRTSFKGSEHLRCSLAPSPQWSRAYSLCGKNYKGEIFFADYKICEMENYDVTFYKICYDDTSNRVLYASNVIMSPGLLNLNLLTRERSVSFPIVISDDPIFSNHPIKYVNENEINPKKPNYRLQQLIPHGDMVFAAWGRTTYSNLNYEWQHKELFHLWDEISANIRSIMKKYTTSKEVKFIVHTAIIDINSTSKDDNQLFNIWLKMAYVTKIDPVRGHQVTHGTAILMNNFLHENESSNNRHEAIEKYCFKNLCIRELINKFTEIGGRIRCCRITSRILENFQFHFDVKEELRVPNVTFKEGED